jgi:hypothetical protein
MDTNAAMEERCFRCGVCRDVISRTVMPYACPAWELAADTHLLKFQRLKNKVISTNGNFPRCTPVRDLHAAFSLPYIYDYIIKLCRKQAKAIQNEEKNMFAVWDKVKPGTENIRELNLVVV